MGFNMAEKKKIRTEYAKWYRKAKEADKTKILDEYLKLVGKDNRKYAIFILNREGKKQLRLVGGKCVNVEITCNHRKKGFTKNTTMRLNACLQKRKRNISLREKVPPKKVVF
jgi:hypothetical protein